MIKTKPLPAFDRIAQLLRYCPETGCWTWRCSRGSRRKGSIAGRAHPRGYIHIRIDGCLYAAHRLAWLAGHGEDPGELEIDHINGDPGDNRLDNLRPVNRLCQTQNTKKHRDSTSGVKGVSWDKGRQKWFAFIQVNQKRITLGRFADIKAAAAARHAADLKYHGEYSLAASRGPID